MSRLEWGALALVLATVMGLQLVGHGGGEHSTDGHADRGTAAERAGQLGPTLPDSAAQAAMFPTVAPEVRGMT